MRLTNLLMPLPVSQNTELYVTTRSVQDCDKARNSYVVRYHNTTSVDPDILAAVLVCLVS